MNDLLSLSCVCITEKPGVCPKIQILGVCEELCSQDGDCLNDEKCCSNGCGHQCMAPSKVKPGVCPRKALGIGLCHVLECVDDIDCPNDEKCCSTKCGRECTPPFIAKPGMCPRNNVKEPVFGVCAELCSRDSDCPNDQKCCSNGCGHQCMPPYKGIYIILMCGSIYFLMQ
uniref:WAP domain-containing protein n=1 Tax=Cyprinus carpio TaxID=7962 RepID=A0A8C1P6W1_CYPCA